MHRLILISLICYSGISFSQEILIPFRKGNLWGFADTLGNLVCEPKYDEVFYSNEKSSSSELALPDKYFLTSKNGKFGVFYRNEVVPAQYVRIRCVDDYLFMAFKDLKNDERDWYSLSGVSLLPNDYKIVSRIGKFAYLQGLEGARYYCHIVQDKKNKTFGIYYFDTQMPARSRFLIKDCYDIKYERDRITQDMELEIDLSVNVKKEHGRLKYNQEKEEIELVYESAKDYSKRVKEIQDASYQESMDIRDEVEGIPADDYYIVEEPPKKKVEAPISTYLRCSFNRKNDTLSVNMINTRYSRIVQPAKNVFQDLPKNAENINLINYLGLGCFAYQKADTLFQYYNYVTYQLRGKKGLLTSNFLSPFYADSIVQIRTDGFNESGYSFLFGQKDKSGKMLLGWMTAEGKEVIPAMYDSIGFKSPYVSPEYNVAGDKWIIKKKGKFGMIKPDGTSILDANYDAIDYFEKSYATTIFRRLKKDGKYGLYYLENDGIYLNNNWIFLKPFTPYKITALRFIPRGKEKNKNFFTLFRLEDDTGKLIGYRSKSDIDFFED